MCFLCYWLHSTSPPFSSFSLLTPYSPILLPHTKEKPPTLLLLLPVLAPLRNPLPKSEWGFIYPTILPSTHLYVRTRVATKTYFHTYLYFQYDTASWFVTWYCLKFHEISLHKKLCYIWNYVGSLQSRPAKIYRSHQGPIEWYTSIVSGALGTKSKRSFSPTFEVHTYEYSTVYVVTTWRWRTESILHAKKYLW